MAMIAMTTSNSISVNDLRIFICFPCLFRCCSGRPPRAARRVDTGGIVAHQARVRKSAKPVLPGHLHAASSARYAGSPARAAIDGWGVRRGKR
ncbi:MAG: hypothetical protein WC485_02345, partial [Opitutaceae bacterium]